MALQPKFRSNQVYAKVQGKKISNNSNGHMTLSSIHSDYDKVENEESHWVI